jgi:hypothetical protein
MRLSVAVGAQDQTLANFNQELCPAAKYRSMVDLELLGSKLVVKVEAARISFLASGASSGTKEVNHLSAPFLVSQLRWIVRLLSHGKY